MESIGIISVTLYGLPGRRVEDKGGMNDNPFKIL